MLVTVEWFAKYIFIADVYDEMSENADEIWKFYQYQLITEFEAKPIFPPPLSIFDLAFLVAHTIRKFRKRRKLDMTNGPIKKKQEEVEEMKTSNDNWCIKFFQKCCNCCRNRKVEDEDSLPKTVVVEEGVDNDDKGDTSFCSHIGNDPVKQFEREAQAAIYRAKKKADLIRSQTQLDEICNSLKRLESLVDQLGELDRNTAKFLSKQEKKQNEKMKKKPSQGWDFVSQEIRKRQGQIGKEDDSKSLAEKQIDKLADQLKKMYEKMQRMNKLRIDLKKSELPQLQPSVLQPGYVSTATLQQIPEPFTYHLPPSGHKWTSANNNDGSIQLPVAGKGLTPVPRPLQYNFPMPNNDNDEGESK